VVHNILGDSCEEVRRAVVCNISEDSCENSVYTVVVAVVAVMRNSNCVVLWNKGGLQSISQ